MRFFQLQQPASLHPQSASLPSRFQDFPGPYSFSTTFQVLEILQTQFQDFPGGMGTLQETQSHVQHQHVRYGFRFVSV